MARIELAPEVMDDLDRILDHLLLHESPDAPSRVRQIVRAVHALEDNPLIGRGCENGKHELVSGHDARGHIAQYRYIPEIDTVFVLAIRSQCEAGHVRESL